MNYLGHLLITYPGDELTMGNLLGDMLRAKQLKGLPENIQKGVNVHHFIDRFTDQHKGIRRLVQLLRSRHGKYAPVVLDVLLDHVLSLQWDEHSDISFAQFTDWVYHTMVPSQIDRIPDHVSKRILNMATHRWLDGYPSRAGMAYVLERMDHRTAFPSRFKEAMTDFDNHRMIFEHEFRMFYQELKSAFADEFIEPITNQLDQIEKPRIGS
jgi:acyl carrier protein phosphodiesterase